MAEKKQVPIEEGVFTMPSSPSEEPKLIGAKCPNCGEKFFPPQERCPRCCYERTEQVLLGPEGEIFTSTAVYLPAPPYSGPVPYFMGEVKLTDNVLVPAIFAWDSELPPPIGTKVKLILEKLKEGEDGVDLMAYKFKPI